MIELTYIIMLVFGILQIILFFKIWGMTNDVNEFKKLYIQRSEELSLSIDKLSKALRDLKLSKVDEQKVVIKEKVETSKEKEVINEIQHETIPEELPIIDENSDEFKQHLHKWKILKGKKYTEQAIKEYMEYTKHNRDIATEFISSI